MKSLLINSLKKYHWLYVLYFYMFSGILKFLGLFLRSTDKAFLIVCYGGQQFGDNIKPIYEALVKDPRFKDWRFIWAFRNPDKFLNPLIDRTYKCKIDTPSFYYHALKSKCWLTNVSLQRGLNFKNKGTFYVNTWHGVPLKHIGLDIKEGTSFKVIGGAEKFDLICTMGSYDAEIAKTAFGVDYEKIKVTGYPRNDIMFKEDIESVKKRVRSCFDVDFSKKVVLYAPTFRDYNKNKYGAFYFELSLSFEKFMKVLGDNYTLIVRAHGAITSKQLNGYIDASDYPDVEDLLRITDILITDYSGIMFDYSLLGKPTICFPYDLQKYQNMRGLYINYNEFIPFPKCKTEEELYLTIRDLNYSEGCNLARKFVNQCGLIDKDSAQNVVDALYEKMVINTLN